MKKEIHIIKSRLSNVKKKKKKKKKAKKKKKKKKREKARKKKKSINRKCIPSLEQSIFSIV